MERSAENDDLVERLICDGALHTPRIINAFESVDRKDFVTNPSEAYLDKPLSIGTSETVSTISQPTTVAIMFELLNTNEGDKVLDIGSGSGWTTALLAHVVGKKGNVTGLEIVPELVDFGAKNLSKYDFENAEIVQAQKGVLGIPGKMFNRILVSASAQEFPEELLDQLKEGGVIVIPVKNSLFGIKKRIGGKIEKVKCPGFVFVPLVG